MTSLSLRLAIVFSIASSSLALAVPAGAQLAGGRSALDAHPYLEFVQFGDFWGDRRSSYRNDFLDPYWGERPQIPPPSSIIPTIPTIRFIDARSRNRRRTNPSSRRRRARWRRRQHRLFWSSVMRWASGWRMGLKWCLPKLHKLASCARSSRI